MVCALGCSVWFSAGGCRRQIRPEATTHATASASGSSQRPPDSMKISRVTSPGSWKFAPCLSASSTIDICARPASSTGVVSANSAGTAGAASSTRTSASMRLANGQLATAVMRSTSGTSA
jgi:hypothetical protein